MSSDFGVNGMLQVVDDLGAAIRDYVSKARELQAADRAKTAAEARAAEAETRAQSSKTAGSVSQVEAQFQQAQDRVQRRFEARENRIRLAHKSSLKRALGKVEEQEGRKRYKLQSGANEAERRRETELAGAAATLAEFQLKSDAALQILQAEEQKARGAFRGYRAFLALLSPAKTWPEPDLKPGEDQIFDELGQLLKSIEEELHRFQKQPLPRLFKYLKLWLLILLLALGGATAAPLLRQMGVDSITDQQSRVFFASALLLVVILYFIGKFGNGAAARAIAGKLAAAERLRIAGLERASVRSTREQERSQRQFDETVQTLNEKWQSVVEEAAALRARRPLEMDEKAARISRKNDQWRAAKLEQLGRDLPQTLLRLQEEGEILLGQIVARHTRLREAREAGAKAAWTALESEWNQRARPAYEAIQTANLSAGQDFPEWRPELWDTWSPPGTFKAGLKFGRMEIDAWKLAGVDTLETQPTLPGPATLSVPLSLTYPSSGSILFETGQTGSGEALAAVNNIMFRLLSVMPPGKISFTIFDPVGLGQSFAGLMHLADYEESLVNSRIWTQTAQFEEKLAALNEHMEKVIQMYLRNEYATIADYNAQAGVIAEKYHFLVVADFPVNFSATAIRRLLNIASSGARCGVHLLVQWDQRQPQPPDFVPDELRKNSLCLVRGEKGFQLAQWRRLGARLFLDPPPTPGFATRFLHQVGQSSRNSNRVEVPFSQIAPEGRELWTIDTTEELRVPIGRSGATKLQYLALGKGTRQHALIAGKTGSGKSTLFHVIITNLALWCSPRQVEFYLVDFKKGVEFKCYARHRLPHARVVAIESDREFGLSVLQRVDAELRRRGDLFRKLGVQDLAGYKRSGHPEPVPRSLLMIDEFQEFFIEEDRVSQGAAVLLDRIVRQGRAFGIHVVLGSQTLGGAYTLARATLGQMVVRIALQCNEADAYLIMDQDNPAPRLLSRPGEGIYNDAAGSIEGNSPFQAVWLSDQTRDSYLDIVEARAAESVEKYPGPFVFEGNAPADARDNPILDGLLREPAPGTPVAPRIWLGAPNAIKGPTEAVFLKRSGGNLLIVGQNEEPALAVLAVALISLAAQYAPGFARFVLIDGFPLASPQREFLDRVIKTLPHEIIQPRGPDLALVLGGLASELDHAQDPPPSSGPSRTFLLVHGLQTHAKLRQDDDFGFSSGDGGSPKPATAFLRLLNEGPSHGIHIIAHCDSYNNVVRFLGRKTLGEFETRVLFQMSASDSASLMDAPDAAALGLHRALLYNDREGSIESFRPYALPSNDWIDKVASSLAQRAASV